MHLHDLRIPDTIHHLSSDNPKQEARTQPDLAHRPHRWLALPGQQLLCLALELQVGGGAVKQVRVQEGFMGGGTHSHTPCNPRHPGTQAASSRRTCGGSRVLRQEEPVHSSAGAVQACGDLCQRACFAVPYTSLPPDTTLQLDLLWLHKWQQQKGWLKSSMWPCN
jgi:hypothetical protein